MPIMTHIALQVREPQRCREFYQEYCGMQVCGEHPEEGILWLAEPGREREMALMLMPGGAGGLQRAQDHTHLGFAADSRAEVDRIAERARSQGLLLWEPREVESPQAYYCGVRDPDGNAVAFSYGQPWGVEKGVSRHRG